MITVQVWRLIAFIAFFIALVSIAQDVHQIASDIHSRRYLDCVMSPPAGDEMLCKQVTVSDPPYQPK